MSIELTLVKDDLAIIETAAVAESIWQEYWPTRIGQEQTDYMVNKFQSPSAIAADINEHGYLYYLIFAEDGRCLGYTAACFEDFTDSPNDPASKVHGEVINQRALKRLFISKIYLYAEERGKHFASRVIEFYEELCHNEGVEVMYLTVNRFNELGVRAYLGRGFTVIEEYVGDIGGGFVMDDYIMAKTVADD